MAGPFTSKDFQLANGTNVWVSVLPANKTIPDKVDLGTVATGQAVAAGAETITLNQYVPRDVFAGQLINFGAGGTLVQVVLTEDAAYLPGAGQTVLQVRKVKTGIPAGTAGSTLPLTPLYSVRQASTQRGEESINNRNFNSGIWDSKAIVMRSWTMSCSGTCVLIDKGYDILAAQSSKTGLESRLYVEVREPNGLGETGVAYVQGLERTRENDNQVQLSWTFLGDGPLTDLPVFPVFGTP